MFSWTLSCRVFAHAEGFLWKETLCRLLSRAMSDVGAGLAPPLFYLFNAIRIFFILVPFQRVFPYVGSDFIQFGFIPYNMLIIIPLPYRASSHIQGFSSMDIRIVFHMALIYLLTRGRSKPRPYYIKDPKKCLNINKHVWIGILCQLKTCHSRLVRGLRQQIGFNRSLNHHCWSNRQSGF